MKEIFNSFVGLICETHGPGTLIGDAVKDMSAADLINLLKESSEPLYEAVEELLTSLIDDGKLSAPTDSFTDIDIDMTF